MEMQHDETASTKRKFAKKHGFFVPSALKIGVLSVRSSFLARGSDAQYPNSKSSQSTRVSIYCCSFANDCHSAALARMPR